MSDDIADAIENIENADELDDETRDKLKQALADSEESGGDDDPDETRVDENPMGAQVEADDEDKEASEQGGEETDDGGGDLDEETREQLKDVLEASESDEAADSADDEDSETDEAASDAEEGADQDASDETDEAAADSGDATSDDEASSEEAGESDEAGDDGVEGFEVASADSIEEVTEFDPPVPDGAIGGVFTPGDIGEGEGDDGDLDSAYLGAKDIEGYEERETNPTIFLMGGFVVLLMVGFSWFLLNYTEQGERMKHLFQGDLKTYEAAKARQIEERFKREQLNKMPKYGNLSLNGQPKYANIMLDGRIQYGKIPKTGEWRPVLLSPSTQFQNLNVAEQHDVKVMAPNHENKSWTLTEQMWRPVGQRNMNFEKKLTVNLMPESSAKQIEYQQRLQKNPDKNYFGKVTINSKPEGAKIIFDGKPLLNKDGEQMTTPATFEKVYWKKKKEGNEGEDGKDGLKEQKIKVDMPPDRGHKIQLRMTDEKLDTGGSGDSKGGKKGGDKGINEQKVAKKKVGKDKKSGQKTKIKDYGPDEYPKFVTPLERQMWTCKWKDGEKPEEPPYPEHCNYSYELNVDFNKLKGFIEHKKKQRKEVKKRNDELKKKLKDLKKKLKNR